MHAQVYLASWNQTRVAVKYLTKESEVAEKEFVNEVRVMSECFHPNIVQFYSACLVPNMVGPCSVSSSPTPKEIMCLIHRKHVYALRKWDCNNY